MIHRWMSARVKRGTNITGKAERSASVPSVTNKRKIAVGLYPPDRELKRQKEVRAGCGEAIKSFSN